ncbi:Lysophospholipase, alpha-beta hydrolase superfamily [Blastococcus aurantiacus]|uniref:Lysophospholipase, alpha-beta hydrolase superfamily n=1 Tax=Blastococcus aurantiacus TaxID=1550231 RepID=A0A1G7KWS7_9ACTN|nr:alpha/beta hydrolase [Blastococcus aurantiacus]SDF41655.1 Lysophospholipase, alpha-beta hydrolase superfamily [Blastococcus aurantiacus]
MVLPGASDSPAPPAVAPNDLRQLADHNASSRTFEGGAGPLAALDTGPGPEGTVLMVAGYTGSKEDFAPLLAPLSASGYRVVAIDQRGQFESPGPDDPSRYSVAELAEDVVAVARVLREESGAPLHLLGHSFGGLVTRAAVLTEPELFRSFTLLGSGPAALTGGRAELLDHLAPLLDEGGVELVHRTMEQLAMTDPKAQAVPAPTREFYARRFLRNSGPGLRGMADAMTSEPDRVEELKAIGVPVLVAHGEADDAWMPHVQEDMAKRLGARHEVIEDSIHSPAVENPPKTVAVLCDFWGSVAA